MFLRIKQLLLLVLVIGMATSCVSNKKYAQLKTDMQADLDQKTEDLFKCGKVVDDYVEQMKQCNYDVERLKGELKTAQSNSNLREEQISDLKDQINDIRSQRDKQLEQVGDLTVLSKSANDNISETLNQLQQKDQYINLLQAAKTKADSINLALAVNLKGVLSQGIADNDIQIQVDKTVVFVNLSDKMLFQSGRSKLTPKAYEVLGKVAKIVQSKPNFEVMVEGYTDNQPINRGGITDNWDLSVKRSTEVVRTLQKNFGVDPNRLIAAGRGEYNAISDNSTTEGRAMNRRTRIIILPKIDQFYDLLGPQDVPD